MLKKKREREEAALYIIAPCIKKPEITAGDVEELCFPRGCKMPPYTCVHMHIWMSVFISNRHWRKMNLSELSGYLCVTHPHTRVHLIPLILPFPEVRLSSLGGGESSKQSSSVNPIRQLSHADTESPSNTRLSSCTGKNTLPLSDWVPRVTLRFTMFSVR